MRNYKTLIAAFAGLIAFAGLAISQSITPPQVTNINGSVDLMQVIPGGVPSAQSQYANAWNVTSQFGYKKLSPANTTTNQFTFATNQVFLVLTAGETVTNLSVTLAAAPNDGARECFFSTFAVTNLKIIVASTQTLNNAITTLSAATGACYTYSASNLNWDRS